MNMMILVLSLAAATAQAASNPQPGARSEANQVPQAKTGAETKYCISYEDVTGSRTSGGKVCRTRAQWASDGSTSTSREGSVLYAGLRCAETKRSSGRPNFPARRTPLC